MTDDDCNILTAAAKNGLVGLAVTALRKLGPAVALDILDKIEAGRCSLNFAVSVCGRDTELVGHVIQDGEPMHLFTVHRTEPPAPRIN